MVIGRGESAAPRVLHGSLRSVARLTLPPSSPPARKGTTQPFGAHRFRVHPPRGDTVAARRHSFQTFLPSGGNRPLTRLIGSHCDLRAGGVAAKGLGLASSTGLVGDEPARGRCGGKHLHASSRFLNMPQGNYVASKAAFGPAAAASHCLTLTCRVPCVRYQRREEAAERR